MKRCARCGFTKPITEFLRNKARHDGVQTYCTLCTKRYRQEKTDYAARYAKRAEAERRYVLERYWRDPEKVRRKRRKIHRDPVEYARHKDRVIARGKRLRAAVFAAYGGETCACCGEMTPEFMTIDHIDGCGAELRKVHGLGQSFYGWLIRNNFPPGFQVLCFNCNMGRAKNGGVCPHKVASE